MFGLFKRPPKAANLYRIVRYGNGYEPQMSYTAGAVKGTFWFPLNADGYWLEPDAFNEAAVTMRISMTKEAAKQALVKAQSANHKLKVVDHEY